MSTMGESEQDDSTAQAPEIDAADARLGSCGCVDYHYADCPLRTGSVSLDEDYYEGDYE